MNLDVLQGLIPWETSILVPVALGSAALFYFKGCRQHRQVWYRKLCYWAGLVCFYAVSATHFDYYSEHEFFMHRIQHSILHHLAPFLIAFSRPGKALWAGVSLHKNFSCKPINDCIEICNHPAVAPLLFCGLIVFWLTPNIHFIGMLDWRYYRLMNWSMAINGLMFWGLVLNNYAIRPAAISPACRIMMMLAIIPAQIVIGVLIFVSPHELYPIYSACGRAFLNVTVLEDQQLGGLILWIPAAMTSVAGVLIVVTREWIHPDTNHYSFKALRSTVTSRSDTDDA